MIPNITHSTGSGKYLGYDLGDKKEQYQKVQFLAAEGVMFDDRLIDRLNQNWEDGDEKGYQAFRKVSMAIANDLDDQFRAQSSLNGRPKIRAINVSLSYSPEDTDKVNEVVHDETRDDYVPLRLKMGREFLDGMGFGDIQYVAVSHLGTHCAHDHYAINTVRADGTTIKLNFDFVRAQKLAAEIRLKYGLTPPDESLQMIAPKAREALKQSCDWEEYGQALREHGISLVISDHSKNGRGYGVSYTFGTKVIPGSTFHRSLSYGQVDAALARNRARRNLVTLAKNSPVYVVNDAMDATLYVPAPVARPDQNEIRKLETVYEAARTILKYKIWGASVRRGEPEEFADSAAKSKAYGTVRFNLDQARYYGMGNDYIIANPKEVIHFFDETGTPVDLFTAEFWAEWRRRAVALKRRIEQEKHDANQPKKQPPKRKPGPRGPSL